MVNPYSPPAETPKERRPNSGLITANLVAAVVATVFFIVIGLVEPAQSVLSLGYSQDEWNNGRLTNPRIQFTLFCNLFAASPFLLGVFDLAVLRPGRPATRWQWASFLLLLSSMGLQMAVLASDQLNGSLGIGFLAAAAIYLVVTTPAMIIGTIWKN